MQDQPHPRFLRRLGPIVSGLKAPASRLRATMTRADRGDELFVAAQPSAQDPVGDRHMVVEGAKSGEIKPGAAERRDPYAGKHRHFAGVELVLVDAHSFPMPGPRRAEGAMPGT